MKQAIVVTLMCALSACATAPTADQAGAIAAACAVDAGLRPTVSALLPLADVREQAAAVSARAVIDPICANPSGTPQANALAAVTGATAQLATIVQVLSQRRTARR